MLGRVAEDMLGESAVVGPEEVLGASTVETRIYHITQVSPTCECKCENTLDNHKTV